MWATHERQIPTQLSELPQFAGPLPAALLGMVGTPGTRALRRGRISLAGQIYIVTTVTRERARIFSDWRVALAAARAISSAACWPHSRLLCWVLMPDHWHGLVELRGESLSATMNRMKSMVAKDVRKISGLPAPTWMKGFHDHALRAKEDLTSVARYIVMNPVRAGLANRVGAYPFWDAVWL